MDKNQCDSKVQRDIETAQFKAIKEKFPIPDLQANPSLKLPGNPNSTIVPDFYSESAHLIGEIYSHLGKLKPAQMHKIAADILKMLLWEKANGIPMKKYIVVCSEQAHQQLKGNTNLAEAIRCFDVEVLYMPLSPELNKELEEAMERQNFYPN